MYILNTCAHAYLIIDAHADHIYLCNSHLQILVNHFPGKAGSQALHARSSISTTVVFVCLIQYRAFLVSAQQRGVMYIASPWMRQAAGTPGDMGRSQLISPTGGKLDLHSKSM